MGVHFNEWMAQERSKRSLSVQWRQFSLSVRIWNCIYWFLCCNSFSCIGGILSKFIQHQDTATCSNGRHRILWYERFLNVITIYSISLLFQYLFSCMGCIVFVCICLFGHFMGQIRLSTIGKGYQQLPNGNRILILLHRRLGMFTVCI